MAEEKTRRRSDSRSGSSDGRKSNDGISARDAMAAAREQLADIIGRPVEGVLGMEKDEDGWRVAVQVVELERIPSSTDLLGKYEVTIGDEGEVTGVKRTVRYYRSQSGED